MTQGHGWYGFGLDVAETQKSVAALRAQKISRPKELGTSKMSTKTPELG